MVSSIICGRAEEVLKTFPSSFVTLTVTSPPFNVGKEYEGYEDTSMYESYLDMIREVFKEVYRITVKGGRLFIDLPSYLKMSKKSRVAHSSIDILNILVNEIGWLHGDLIIWDKGTIISKNQTAWGSWCSASSPYIRDRIDLCFVLYKEQYKLDHQGGSDISVDEFLEFTQNIWRISPEKEMRNYHPAPFPEELAYRAIKLFSFVGDWVLDPFCGTGTTCKVARLLGRRYIGIDVSEKYVKIARMRTESILDFNTGGVFKRKVCQQR